MTEQKFIYSVEWKCAGSDWEHRTMGSRDTALELYRQVAGTPGLVRLKLRRRQLTPWIVEVDWSKVNSTVSPIESAPDA